MQWIVGYFAVLSAIGFFSMAADKRKALRGKRRISEKTLFIIAWLGGSAGVLLGIPAFRHKSRYKKFTVGIPLIMALQAVVCFLIYRWICS